MTPGSLLADLPERSRILIIRLRSIGDIVLLTPALHLLKSWRPDFIVSVLVEARFRELLEGNPDVDEILFPGEGPIKIASRLGAALALRRKKFAVCVNLHGGPTSRFLAKASGARTSVGFAHFRSPQQYQILVPDARLILDQPSLHTAEHQACAFFYLGLPRQEIPRARMFVRDEHKAWWNERRENLGLAPGQDYAMVHPTALYATKQWSAEKFAQLAVALEHEIGLKPVFSCGPGEEAVLDAVQRASSFAIRRLESSGLGQLAAAFSGARLFVGNDSGPAHIAAAHARPLVVIFGSSSSAIWGPWPRKSDPPAQVVQNFYECNPCPGDRCYRFERPECILSVSFGQVKSAVESVLARSVGNS
ncbi:MAG: glycosyltransferase family 9 protein [Terriglobia bacterium]|jgi:ADP-heptose:LPS heptosyltransferase